MPPDAEVIETRLTMLVEHLNSLKTLNATTYDEYPHSPISNQPISNLPYSTPRFTAYNAACVRSATCNFDSTALT